MGVLSDAGRTPITDGWTYRATGAFLYQPVMTLTR